MNLRIYNGGHSVDLHIVREYLVDPEDMQDNFMLMIIC